MYDEEQQRLTKRKSVQPNTEMVTYNDFQWKFDNMKSFKTLQLALPTWKLVGLFARTSNFSTTYAIEYLI